MANGRELLMGVELELHCFVADISNIMDVGLGKHIGPTYYEGIMGYHSWSIELRAVGETT